MHVWSDDCAWADYVDGPITWGKINLYREDVELRKVLKERHVLRDGREFGCFIEGEEGMCIAIDAALKSCHPVWMTVDDRISDKSVCDRMAAKYGGQAVQFALEGPLPDGYDWGDYEYVGLELRIDSKPRENKASENAALAIKSARTADMREKAVNQSAQRKIIGWETVQEGGATIARPVYED